MKKNKFLSVVMGLALGSSFFFISCSGDSDDSVENERSEILIETENAAFNIFRSLCSLPTDDDDENGIEDLPTNWRSLEFVCDEGFVLDEDEPYTRSIAVADLDEAKVYVSSLVGEDLESDDSSVSWTYSGLGSLRFTAFDDSEILATLDVDIPLITNLEKIQFVSADYLNDNLSSSENSYSGLPYYAAGDIIRRQKDGTLWMCVRPAGGDLRKDKSYWICLHPFDKNGNCIIKSESKVYNLAYGLRDKYVITDAWEWTYAKKLMSLKTAKAAAHTLLVLTDKNTYRFYKNAESVYNVLREKGFDLRRLLKTTDSLNDGDLDLEDENTYGFIFAYDNPKKDSNRSKKRVFTNGINKFVNKEYKNYVEKLAQVNYIQPLLCSGLVLKNEQPTVVMATKVNFQPAYTGADFIGFTISATDTFDAGYQLSAGWTGDPFPFPDDYENISNEEFEAMINFKYNFENYLHFVSDDNGLQYKSYDKNDSKVWWGISPQGHVIYTPELCIKDNKGSASKQVKPDSSFEDVYRQDGDFLNGTGAHLDWWESVMITRRLIDGLEADWNKENE